MLQVMKDGMIYDVTTAGRMNYIDDLKNAYVMYDLTLCAGWDYISENSDKQGWVAPSRFVEEVQEESLLVSVLKDSLEGRLTEEGYTIISDFVLNHANDIVTI